MSTIDFIKTLKAQRIQLNVKGDDKLEIGFDGDHIDHNLLMELKERKQEIIDFLKGHEEKEVIRIEKAKEAASYPLSNAQNRLWTLCQFPDANAAYNIPTFIYLPSDLDVECLRKAILSTMDRHEILRTYFKRDENNEMRQWVVPTEEVEFDIPILDFSDERTGGIDEIRAFMETDARKPFDFTHAPLLRMFLLKEPDGDYVFYYNIHHITSDAWSGKIWISNVLSFYEFHENGTPVQLPELRIQYKDFSVWQKEQTHSDKYNQQLKFWLEIFKGDIPKLQLPISKTRPRIKTHRGGIISKKTDDLIVSQLRQFVAEKQGTMFMALITTVSAILHRYSGQNELIIGTPISGRSHRDLENQIGFYLNTLALKTDFEMGDSFSKLFERVKSHTLSAFKNDSVPFDDLVEALNLRADSSRNPLFDVMLVFEASDQSIPGMMDTSRIDPSRGTSKFDLLITAKLLGDELFMGIEYNEDLFEKRHIEKLLLHHELLLSRMLSSPYKAIADLPFVSNQEKKWLLEEINPARKSRALTSVISLFERQVEETPEKSALVCGDHSFSYQELNQQVNRLAHYLRKEIPQGNENVGVLLDRSAESVLAMLAVMKSGNCYVPINPEYPQERIVFMLADAQITHVITQKKHAEINQDVHLMVLDELPLNDVNSVNPENVISENERAFIIYTSGSTGLPKGVIQTHRMINNLTHWNVNDLSGVNVEKHLQYASFSFDVSVQDCWVALSSGATLYVVESDIRLEFRSLLNFIVKHQIDKLVFPYSAMIGLFAANTLEDFGGHNIKHIVSSGEQLYVNAALSDFLNAYPEVMLHNHYGPSETHVVTSFTCKSSDGTLVQRPLIGKPIDNTIVRILDEKGQLLPPNFPGELYLGGDNLADGYINLDELTEQKFVVDPFNPSSKLYKSGDIGYWKEDGNLVYLGRNDNQVKIRGFRIELNEVAQALLSTEGVEDALVTSIQEESTASLVAYVHCSDDTVFRELKAGLKKKLPDYMIPTYFVPVDEIPLTLNGKADISALPEPNQLHIHSNELRAPITDLEKEVAAIWNDLFKSVQTGLDDDFLERGGHSLKAVQLTGIYYRTFNVKIELNEIFKHPVLHEQVTLIQKARKQEYKEIPQAADHESYPLSNAQYRLWILEQFDETGAAYNLFESIRINEKIDPQIFEKSINSVVAKYEILRTVFRKAVNGEVRQWVTQESLPLDVVDLKEHPDKEQAAKDYIERDARTTFDLEKAPLVRIALLLMNEEDAIVYYNMHHIISDGWSMNVFKDEILSAYETITSGTVLTDSSLNIQYKDYTVWQLNGEGLADAKSYWLKQFDQVVEPLELPTELRRPVVKTYRGEGVRTSFSSELFNKLNAFAREEGGTDFIALLSSFCALLNRYTHRDTFVVGMPSAGRNHPDLEKQLGFFVNVLPLKIHLSKNQSFSEVFQTINQLVIENLENQDYPFDALVDELNLERDSARSPLFDILVNSIDKREVIIDESQLSEDIVSVPTLYSKYDLEISYVLFQNAISLNVVFNPDVYEFEMISAFLRHYKVLLAASLASPRKQLNSLNYLLKSELETIQLTSPKVRNEWAGNSIHELFESVVDMYPQKVAMKFGDEEISYHKLNYQVNQLARYLSDKYGSLSDTNIAIQLEKSPWQLISMLAVLKLGAAYVPVNNRLPKKRVDYILSNSQSKLVIDDEELKQFEEAGDISGENIDKNSSVSSRMYILYTSGTTGDPKGVGVSQEGLLLKIQEEIALLSASDSDTSAQLTDYAFDVSLLEFFIPILTGGTLAVPTLKEQADFEQTIDFLIRSSVSILHGTPSYFRNLFKEITESAKEMLGNNLKYICAGGESLPNTLVADLKGIFPDVTINNHYGPTEAIIHAVCKTAIDEYSFNNIGLPLGNTECYILDENKKSVAQGVTGELHLGGPCLAEGYFSNPHQTEKSFIKNPFSGNGKLYCTGDLVRLRRSGDIEFLGRKDTQVKVRGYRIECAEIERKLELCYGVVSSVVQKSKKDEDELIAHFVCDRPMEISELKAHLKSHLPTYMIPKYMVQIDEIPTNSNGKIEYDKLPDQEETERESESNNFVAPSTELEVHIASVWCELLELQKVGVLDDFFELGGNSIRMMKMFGRLQSIGENDFSIRNFFMNPTITQLIIDSKETPHDDRGSDIIRFSRLSEEKFDSNILFLHDVSGELFGYSNLINRLKSSHNCFGFELAFGEDYKSAERLEEWVIRYTEMISSEIKGALYLVGWSVGGVFAHALACALEENGQSVEGLVLLDSYLPMKSLATDLNSEELWFGSNFNSLLEDKTASLAYLRENHPMFFTTYPEVENDPLSVLREKVNSYQFVLRTSRNYSAVPIRSRMLYIAAEETGNEVIGNWRELTSKKLINKKITTNHYDLLKEENVNQIGTYIQEFISE